MTYSPSVFSCRGENNSSLHFRACPGNDVSFPPRQCNWLPWQCQQKGAILITEWAGPRNRPCKSTGPTWSRMSLAALETCWLQIWRALWRDLAPRKLLCALVVTVLLVNVHSTKEWVLLWHFIHFYFCCLFLLLMSYKPVFLRKPPFLVPYLIKYLDDI